MADFGFELPEAGPEQPADLAGKPPAPLSRPLIPSTTEEPLDDFSTIPTISGLSELGEIPTIAEIIGNEIEIAEEISSLQLRQKKYICMIAKHLFITTERITGGDIYSNWPVGMNIKGEISKKITNPEERGKAFRAGPRPSINEIQAYMRTSDYRLAMRELGINIDPNDHGLTAEQMGFLTILSNIGDGKDLRGKLRLAGVSWAKYQVWLKQRDFKVAHDRMLGETLKNVMPLAEQQLAAKIAAGDTNAIKFGMEVTGRHNPNGQRQFEAEAFLGIFLEALEEEVKDQEVLRRIATKVQIRALGMKKQSAIGD